MYVEKLNSTLARQVVQVEHYLHRKPPVSFAFGLYSGGALVGVVTFGTPASHELRKSISPADPSKVIELNRLWVCDTMPRNTESFFVARALALLPARIVVSYADTSYGHAGYIYRALNFNYAGWTDMDRKTPRFDYTVPGRHSREAFRGGTMRPDVVRVRRKPKVKYWLTTGNRRERRELSKLVAWPKLCWKENPPPTS